MNKDIKYTLIIDQIRTGGAERILIDYYHFLKNRGKEVNIFALHGHQGQSIWTMGIEVTYGIKHNHDNIALKTLQQIKLYFKLKKYVKQIKPNILFSFLEKSNLLTILIPTKAKKIVTVHNLLSEQYNKVSSIFIKKILYFLLKTAYNSNKNIIVVSKQVKEDLIESLGVNSNNIHIVNNKVDKKTILQKSTVPLNNFHFSSNVKYVLNIGRFSDQKAQWKLLKAFYVFKQKHTHKDVRLILIGEGENKDQLITLSKKLNISNSVSFLPFTENPYKYMAHADLLVLSSIYEGFPIVLAEASSLRIPFVGTSTAIPKEMFIDKNIWESIVFHSVSNSKNLNNEIMDDEINLADLINKGLFNIDFRKNILAASSQWESSNDKRLQFEAYNSFCN